VCKNTSERFPTFDSGPWCYCSVVVLSGVRQLSCSLFSVLDVSPNFSTTSTVQIQKVNVVRTCRVPAKSLGKVARTEPV